jgi:AraC-like DNA-binding protein
MIRSARPAPALRHLIRYYFQVVRDRSERAFMQPVPARSPQILEFMLGTRYRVHRHEHGLAEPAAPIALVGAQTFRRVDLELHGDVDAFTVAFEPGGFSALFSVPAVELTDADFDGVSVIGHRVQDLYARLGDSSSFSARVCVADDYFAANCSVPQALSSTAQIATQVIRRNGCARVEELAHSGGVSLRQFERRFRYEIGIAPKLYARIVRFEAALRYKASVPTMPWTDIAHVLGYHDQMHMVHDFNGLSGDSPSAICARLDMFVMPEVQSVERSEGRAGASRSV